MTLSSTQRTLLRQELQAAIRGADKRTTKGRVLTDVCLALLDSDAVLAQLWWHLESVPIDEARRRRIYDTGYDDGFNDGLASPKEKKKR